MSVFVYNKETCEKDFTNLEAKLEAVLGEVHDAISAYDVEAVKNRGNLLGSIMNDRKEALIDKITSYSRALAHYHPELTKKRRTMEDEWVSDYANTSGRITWLTRDILEKKQQQQQ
jgi:hypothetical protein